MIGLTLPGAIHAVLAIAGIVVGLLQLLRRKGGPAHRARGYAFVYAMLVADGAVMLVFQFTGRFNVLHVGALANLFCIVAAMIPVLRSPRPPNWRIQHYYWMSWSYIGLLTATATQLVLRIIPFATRQQAWTAMAAISALITVIGFVVIVRYRPVSPSQPAPDHATIQRDGVPS